MVNFIPSLVHIILKITIAGKLCVGSWVSPEKKNEDRFFLFDLCKTSLNFILKIADGPDFV